jgi:predicted AAA+ superfamily ATPase
MSYLLRIADAELQTRLQSAGAVLIEGPKACGKTATGQRASRSMVALDTDLAARQLAAIDPGLVLQGPVPRLLDEWQVAPELWNAMRREVDTRAAVGQFILAGSAVPADDVLRHTGAGRLSRLHMRPMSLVESGWSSGEVSLSKLMEGEAVRAPDTGRSVAWAAEVICRGGWPAARNLSMAAGLRYALDYIEEVCRTDISRVDGVVRNPQRIRSLLRSLARNTATEVTLTSLAKDVGETDHAPSLDTLRLDLQALERILILEEQPAWGPHLRSRSRVRQTPKRHLVDPSLAVAALGASPTRLLGDLNMMGLLFESLVVRDLRILSQPLDGQVFHYRDNTGLEADAIIELRDGRWAAFEVKLGVNAIDSAARSLLDLSARVDHDRCGPPAALVVITSTGYAYRRPDGVSVVPIGVLGA